MEKQELNRLLSLMFQSHPWHGVSAGADAPQMVNTYIEIVPRDVVKYELDKPSGHLRLDRPHKFSSLCPTLYGFVPQTYCGTRIAEFCMQKTGRAGIVGDGDPLDICVITEKTIMSGNFFVNAKPIGGLRLLDHGEADDKIIAVLEKDIAFGEIKDIKDCPQGLIDRIAHYFLSLQTTAERRAALARSNARLFARGSIRSDKSKFCGLPRKIRQSRNAHRRIAKSASRDGLVFMTKREKLFDKYSIRNKFGV